jgi:hypothetical protein
VDGRGVFCRGGIGDASRRGAAGASGCCRERNTFGPSGSSDGNSVPGESPPATDGADAAAVTAAGSGAETTGAAGVATTGAEGSTDAAGAETTGASGTGVAGAFTAGGAGTTGGATGAEGAGAGASVTAAGAAGASGAGALSAAFLAAFLTGAGSSGATSRLSPSRSALRRARSAWASSIDEDAPFTPIPSPRHKSTASLLVSPSSLASSCTRILDATLSVFAFVVFCPGLPTYLSAVLLRESTLRPRRLIPPARSARQSRTSGPVWTT